ncbi:oligosaccharide flippase family protein [Vibrio parahaemolyticus]|uniref:oligosaccharide flippase family protein n=1 Tax=Vibrio parahaemolyticus TaxID=670 RepID=UPI001FAC34DA|nr:oligosaccharide flippase family protein [Vibrio parahaemolyticus]MCI9702471.1 oligosaccharide flippase family protein [Vibrio parahaemolyticus]
MKNYLFILLKSGFWGLIGGAIGKVSVAYAYVILAIKLAPESFGDFSIIQSNIVLFGTFAGLGLGTTAIKLISKSESIGDKLAILTSIIKLFLVSTTLVSLFVIFFSTELSLIFYGDEFYRDLFYLSVPLLVSSSFFSLVSSVYISFGFYLLNGFNSICQGVLLLAYYYFFDLTDVSEAILYLTMSFVFPLIVFIFWMLRFNGYGSSYKYEIKKIIEICIPITLSTLVVVPTNWLITILLARYSPGGSVEVGMFNAASQWKNIILFVPMTLSPVMLSLLSKTTDNVDDSTKLKLNVLVSAFSASIVFLVVYMLSNNVALAYGDDYQGISSLILLYSAITILIVVNNSIGQYFISTGKLNLGFFLNVVWALLYVSISWLLIDKGALGVLYALAISYVSHSILQFFFVILEISKGKKSENLRCI